MVNFHDPAVVAEDNRAYGFTAASGGRNLIDWIFLEVALLKFWHVVDGIFLCVTIFFLLLQNVTNSKATFTAGSSSRISTLSGVSSKDVAAIGGRSGSVVIIPGFCAVGELILLFVDLLPFARGNPRSCSR
jgi:hypothetical protein